ncbi:MULTISPECIES: transcriptional repressor LexA [Bacillus cereus group]|uniref:transcriptional repressor LexA n=1 Tax=Bacillus cereus group TaxID=86661 RepID=UPI0022E8A3EE|nr:transcriptional repressor LexA [Bacillus cereus group sp. TH152-1LC]MDA1675159.1 transcriptional repressor LexA [Bacillus cereus group sp. TH152-1LC]
MPDIGSRQMKILDFLYEEINERGYPPTVREIGERVGLASSSTVHGHLEKLEEKGYILKDPTKPRAIQLLKHYDVNYVKKIKQEKNLIQVPIVGKVTAGQPITAFENVEGYFPLIGPGHINENLFSLRIMGQSMIEAGIFDGDLVIVNQQKTANNGDIVVAMTEENEATVKRFYKEKDCFRLQPENMSMEPIFLKKVTILGKVLSVYRELVR